MVTISDWQFKGGKYAGLSYSNVKEKDIKYLQKLTTVEAYKYKEPLKRWLDSDDPNANPSKYAYMTKEQLIKLVDDQDSIIKKLKIKEQVENFSD